EVVEGAGVCRGPDPAEYPPASPSERWFRPRPAQEPPAPTGTARRSPYAGRRAHPPPGPDPGSSDRRGGAVPGHGRLRLLRPRIRQAGGGGAVPAEHPRRGDDEGACRLLAPARREGGADPAARAQGRHALQHQVRREPGERPPSLPAAAVPGAVPLGSRHRPHQPVRGLSADAPAPPGESVSYPAVTLRSPGNLAGRLGAAAVATAVLAGCGLLSSPAASPQGPGTGPSPAPATNPAGPPPPAAAPRPAPPPPLSRTAPPRVAAAPCPAAPARFSCTMRARIAAVRAYLRHRPGVVGVVLRDRSTGAVWANSRAHTQIYMASTSKLAMAAALLMQNQAGVIHLSS